MTQRNLHIPSRATPNPRHAQHRPPQDEAVDYVRAQVAQIYGNNQSQQATQPPQEYAKTYRETQPTPTYDWQTYHSAWQNYYQQYYQRYYGGQLEQERQRIAHEAHKAHPHTSHVPKNEPVSGSVPDERKEKEIKSKLVSKVESRAAKVKKSPHFKPLVTALVVGLLFLGLQFNRTLMAQIKYYVSPGTVANNSSSIIVNPESSGKVASDPRVIIPKINVDVPVVYGITSYEDSAIQQGLQSGVVHYGTTAMPGQIGNNVIVGHSSNDLFDAGKYKFAFVLLDHLDNGDVIELNYKGKQYVYKVTKKEVVAPTDFSLVNVSTSKPLVTLITCTPPGTALKRLIVQAEQISPNPSGASHASPATTSATLPSTIPGNSPTLLQRIQKLLHF